MLKAAVSAGRHQLDREEILVLSIFRNGNDHPLSLEHVDAEFPKLLSAHAENRSATADLKKAVEGLVQHGLLVRLEGNHVQITPPGQKELERISEAMDQVWDRLTTTLNRSDREALKNLIRRIDPDELSQLRAPPSSPKRAVT